MNVKRILCGVDFSGESVRAFKTAVSLARRMESEILVVHVIEPIPILENDVMALEDKARLALEALVTQWGHGLNGGQLAVEVTTGRAAVELVNRATALEADLMVLGAKGIAMLEEPFVGNTTEQVLKTAGCSVLVVKN